MFLVGNFMIKICVCVYFKEYYYMKVGCLVFLKGVNEGLNYLFIWNMWYFVGGMGEILFYFCGLIVCYFKFCLYF